jgi:malate dehydrogenase (oxaloacetate-decarboxylating)(NADP+)
VKTKAETAGIDIKDGVEISNARLSTRRDAYADYLYARLQRKGYLFRDCVRLINTDRNHFAACMVALGDADALVTGVNAVLLLRHGGSAPLHRPQAGAPHHRGLHRVLPRPHRGDRRHLRPRHAQRRGDRRNRAEAAGVARRLGFEPRVALLAYSTFGNPLGDRAEKVKQAVEILDRRKVDFEYDGEMNADVALNPAVMAAYPFCRLSGPGQRAGHAGAALGGHLHQHAAGARRRHGYRPPAGRLRPPGADPADLRARRRHREYGGAGRV